MKEKSKKLRSKYFYAVRRTTLPFNPMMPAKYNAKKRAELREWEQEILSSKSENKERDDER